MYIIEGNDILVQVRDHRILDVDCVRLAKGKVFAVIGPNGSGKSTLLRVLSLLQKPNTGYITFKGKKVLPGEQIKIRRKMAVVFQESLLLDTSVLNNVMTGLKIRGIDHSAALKTAQYWLERFKVSHLSNRWAKAISGGEAQRVSLARAFAMEPEVMFLDEPFSNLDAPTREELLDELSEVLHSTGVTTFFVSHDFEEVAFLADNAMALMDGKPVQEAPPKEIFSNPVNEALSKFVGAKKRRKWRI
ncbi:MAG TPA: ATP-binding cassette domain-containing protein [Thermoanaerobacterales bacterium]|jgi:tungstate transport system ATP-binding protein|nr:ATP-binding cassette domain-containing protein [Thermoanaerobacterales bacterium]